MNAAELNTQILTAATDLRNAIAELEERSKAYAMAERIYRRDKSVAYLSTTGTVAEREARAENAINEVRYNRDLAEGLRTSALEAVRANRGILSAIQTLTNLSREEAAFDRTGGSEQPRWGEREVSGENYTRGSKVTIDADEYARRTGGVTG